MNENKNTKNIMENEVLVKMDDEALHLIENLNDQNEYNKWNREANAMEAIGKMINTVLITNEKEKDAFHDLLEVISEYTELLGIISKIQIR